MSKAAAYYRVSTEAQAAGDRNSLPAQRSAFVRWCATHGYEPAGEFQDVMSGRKSARPGYQAMLAAAARHEFDVIVVTYLDRFGRDDREVTLRVLTLEESGVKVETTEESVEDFLHLALGAWKAGQESARTASRVRFASQTAVRRGRALGMAPFGYRKAWTLGEDGSKQEIRLEPDPAAAPVVQRIFAMYLAENASLLTISTALNRDGIAPPKGLRWRSERIRELLRRETYAGDFTWGETTLRDAHPALVSRETFDAVQERLDVKGAMARGWTQKSEYLLSGLARCGHCGSRMMGHRSTPSGKVYLGYLCIGRRKFGTCAHNAWQPAATLEDSVIAALADVVGAVSVTQRVAPGREALDKQRAQAYREIDRARAGFLRNMGLYERGSIASEEQLRDANQRLSQQQSAAEATLARLDTIERDTAARDEQIAALPARYQSLTDILANQDRRAAKAEIQQMVSVVTVYDDTRPPTILLRVP